MAKIEVKPAVIALTVVVAGVVGPQAAQRPRLSTDRLVATAAAYLSDYQREFAFLIADETAVQHVVSQSEGVRDEDIATRVTHGEMFVTYLHGRRHWTSVRDVVEVDGVAVVDREDIRRLLDRDDIDAVARRLFGLNARFNIGRVVRNFNDPMLALLPLNEVHRRRFAFSTSGNDQRSDGTLARVRFRERERPTLVRSSTGGAVYAAGEFTLDTETGTVRRTRIAFEYDNIEAELTTDFRYDSRLDLWVPAVLLERYTSARDGRHELTTVESRYTNYRRFEVGARVRLP